MVIRDHSALRRELTGLPVFDGMVAAANIAEVMVASAEAASGMARHFMGLKVN